MEHETGDPLQGAAVSLGPISPGSSGRGTRAADGEGRFRFEDVPEGAYHLTVTAPGFRPMADTFRVEKDVDLILPLSRDTIHLAPIVVMPQRPPSGTGDYARRRRAGGSGFLVTRKEIEERHPRFLTELLHRVPGGMVVPAPPHGYTLVLRAQCRPGIWMDGVELAGAGGIDQLISPQDVEAVEVFHGFELPVEFGVNPCGGVLIWTRSGPSLSSGGGADTGWGLLGRLLRVAAAVLVVVILAR